MSKKSIEENEAIQSGLEKFLEEALSTPDPVIPTSMAPSSQQTKPKPDPSLIQPVKQKRERPVTRQVQQINTKPDPSLIQPVKQKRERPATRQVQQAKPKQAKPPRKKASLFPAFIKKASKKAKRNKKEKRKLLNMRKRRAPKNKDKKPKWKKVLSILIFLMLAFLILWYFVVAGMYQKMGYEKADSLSSGSLSKDGVTNILLIGNDSREKGEDGRSDAMILLSISNNTKTIHMTSLLRDMYVEIPGYEGNRLNAAYSYGGAALLCQTIEQNLDIEINRYVLVNFQAFASLVDAVGGVDLELTNDEVQWVNAYLNEYNLLEGKEMTTDYLDTSLSGEIHLNGPQALAYTRNRKIGTDFARTERQRKVLSQLMKKMPLAMATNSKEVIDGLFPNLTTNLTQLECYQFSFNAGKLLTYEVTQGTIPAEGTYSNANIRGMAVLEVDFEANKELWKQGIYKTTE